MKIPTTRTKIATAGLYAVGLVLCLGISKFMWQRVADSVNSSYKSYAFDPQSSLAQRLNNANTYYWYARYRKNSQPEFERSLAISQEILSEVADSLKAYPTRSKQYQTIQTQAETLANYCREQSEVSQLNIASYVPMYLEMMAHDEAFMEQDCEDEEVETRAANRAIDVLLELISPEKNAKISERPLFALVQARGEPKAIHESIIQKLNAESKFYTISDHELVKILGPGATYQNVFNDSAALVDVAKFYGAKSIALIDLVNNDQVDGIHYFGMQYSIWQQGENSIKDGVYTEYFVRNRNFNQMTIMKIPLFIGYMGIIGAVGFIIALALLGLNSLKFTWYSLWIPISGALVTAIATIDYLFMEFLNPLPSDYYATDAGEVWQISLPLVLIALPVVINYIILGRLDKHISSFKSKLDEPSGLFGLVAGSLAVIPLIWVNYRIMRFGVEPQTLAITLYAMVLYLTYGFGLSRWMHKILDFPQKVDWRRRALAYLSVAALIYCTYQTTSELIIGSTIKIDWLYVALVGVCPLLLELLYGKIPLRANDPIVLDKIKPVNIENLELSQGKWKYLGEQSSLLRVRASKSLNPSNYIISEKTASEVDWHVIDFSQRGDGKVHYYPFAKAFEHLFTHKRFNDVAEQSRIIGNLLGKLISTISSVGDYLIDESDPKPRNVNEVAEMIIDALDNDSYGLFFQHPESATKEDLALLGAILPKLVSKDSVPVAFCEGVAYALQEEFDFTLKQYGIQLGMDCLEFDLAFTNLAQSILSEGSIEPTSRVLIEERLISSELEQSSVLAKRAVSQLLESPQVFKNNFGQLQLKSSQFEFVSDGSKNDSLTDLSRELRVILDSSAIAADDLGMFNIDLVTAVSGMSRKEVLNHLDELQAMHLVFDRQDDAHIDLYQFADIEIVKELRQEDEHVREHISQNVREYYRAYVAYFLPHPEWDESKKHLVAAIEQKRISERELTFLAMRALRVGAVSFIEELLDFVLSRTISEGLSANFDGAKQLIDWFKSLHLDNVASPRMQWLEFVLNVETGAFLFARKLYESGIRQRAEGNKLTHSELLLCVRYCFGDFMHGDNAQHGKTINDSVLHDPKAEPLDVLRATFYTTKLIANKDKNLNESANKDRVKEVLATYEGLVTSLDGLYKNDGETKGINLFKEVLNDYLGFIADNVWSQILKMPEFGLDKDSTIERFLQLKANRLQLEGKNEKNWLDPSWVKRGTDTDYRGLCYTYNYIQRGLEHLDRHEESIKAGMMSFALNSYVGDHNGKQVCAGYLSKSLNKLGKVQDGLYWAQQSVAYAHSHGLYYSNALTNLVDACRKVGDNTAYQQLSQIITQRHIVKHFDINVPIASMKRLLLTREQLNLAQSEAGSRFHWDRPVNFNLLDRLALELQSCHETTNSTVEVNGILVKIDKVQTMYGKVEFELTFPSVIGTTTVIPIDNESYTTELIERGGSMVLGVRGIEPKETQQCALIVQNFGPDVPWHIITSHPGVCAPPLPKSGVPVESDPFWSKHAFILSTKQTK